MKKDEKERIKSENSFKEVIIKVMNLPIAGKGKMNFTISPKRMK